jgi:hypothetical protein
MALVGGMQEKFFLGKDFFSLSLGTIKL